MNVVPLARLLLLLAYPVFAHLASLREDGTFAALALADLVFLCLLEPLLRVRPWAWALTIALCAGIALLARSPLIQLPLLLVPPAFVALIAWTFGRTLREGRTPLITRIVVAIEGHPADRLDPALADYTRKLTATWAAVLAGLAVANLLLAMCAVPGGLLDSLGVAPPVAVSHHAWSWFANMLNYGVVGGLFVGEYFYRGRRFPGRYTSFFDFLRRMAGLGPAVWRGLLRD